MTYLVKHPAFMDCQVTATGSHSAGTTSFVMASRRPFTHAFYKPTGEVLTLTTSDYITFTVSGNYSGGESVLGRVFDMEMLLSEPFLKDGSGTAILSGKVNVRRVTFWHMDTPAYNVQVTRTGLSDYTESYSNTATYVDDGSSAAIGRFGTHVHDRFSVPILSDSTGLYVYVKSSSPTPVTITGVEIDTRYTSVPR